jgi:hypothetical protein
MEVLFDEGHNMCFVWVTGFACPTLFAREHLGGTQLDDILRPNEPRLGATDSPGT